MKIGLGLPSKIIIQDVCKGIRDCRLKYIRLLIHNHVQFYINLFAVLNLQAEEKKDRHYDLTADHSSNSRVSYQWISTMIISMA